MSVFTIKENQISLDDDGNEVMETVDVSFTGDLTDGIFTATDEDGVIRINQPFNFDADGNRIAWNDLDEAIAWVKTNNAAGE
jgi:hypothetical protein